MRHKPSGDKWDEKELADLNCEAWMVALLDLNPGYVCWGPHEDYMLVRDESWASPLAFESWKHFDLKLDELNEVVNFYFMLARDARECETCAGSGYHPDAQWVTESFYSHSSPFKQQTPREQDASRLMDHFAGSERRRLRAFGSYPSEETLSKYGPEFRAFCERMREVGHWGDELDDADDAVLREHGRLFEPPLGHDAINRGILCSGRLKRYGVPETCECGGDGSVFTAPAGHVELVLWLLHPRKGASRGVEVKLIEQDDLPSVFRFLRGAAERNAERFRKVVEP